MSLTGIPLVFGDIVTKPPADLIVEYESLHFGDKVVFYFEVGLTDEEHILDWLCQFNFGNSQFQLQFYKALLNWFFVI